MVVVDPQLQNLPIRAYLDQTVVPILLDGTSRVHVCVWICHFLVYRLIRFAISIYIYV